MSDRHVRQLNQVQRIRPEHFTLTGIIKARATPPDLTHDEWLAWWGRLTEKERDRYTVYETHNVITTAGRSAILTYIGNNLLTGGSVGLGNCVPFAMEFSVGTGAIATVGAGDTGVIGELFRAAPTSSTIAGNSVSISTFFGAAQGNGTYSNAGLYGNGASGTLGSGVLFTHALYTYVKTGASSLTSSYLINLN